MNDWIGLLFFVSLIVGIVMGLRALAKPRKTTGEEFEKNVSESASMMSASMNALNEMLNPGAAKSREVQTQLKEGRFKKKERDEEAD
ncbi:MAG: hypothetical protein KIS76_12520 [Pyrinomonadaceae bacterium]|nr:hypothetical protein [Pyrinomonadaceae bacterium]